MKRRLSFSLLLISLFAAVVLSGSRPASDRWQLIGPYGGPLASIAFHPTLRNVAFASSTDFFDGSLYRTTDGGVSWLRMSLRGSCIVRAHPRQTNYVLAICSDSVYLSNDLGDTWMFQSRRPFGYDIDAEFDPENPFMVYLVAATSRQGILYRSNDAGRSWRPIKQGLPPELVRAEIEVDPFDGRHLYLLAKDGLFISTNSGATWAHQPGNISAGSQDNLPILKIDPSDPRTLYLLQETGLRKTSNSGRTWSVLLYPRSQPASLSVGSGGRILYGEYSGVFQSNNAGKSWSSVPLPKTWPRTTVRFAAIDPFNNGRIYACLPVIGLMKSENNGRSWLKVLNGITEFSDGSVEIADTHPLRILTPASTGWDHLAVTLNSGASWKLFQNIRYDYALTIYPRNPLIWAADSDRGLAITRNAGGTWKFHPLLEEEFAYDLEFDPFDPSTIYAATNIGVQRTTDSGSSWTLVTTTSDSQNPMVLEADPARKGYVFAANRDGRLLRTSDGGSKWEQVSATSCGNNDIEDIQVDPFDSNDVLYATTRFDVNVICNHIFRSSDGGSSWSAVDAPATYGGFYKIYFDTAQRGLLFLLAEYGGVYTSHDGGKTWSLYNMKGTSGVSRLAFSTTQPGIIAGTSQGGVFLFQRSSAGMTLDQTYPNPAPAGSKVTLFGHGFGNAGTLALGPNRITARSWSDTQIEFTLPGDARTASIKIENNVNSVSQELLVLDGSRVYPSEGPSAGGTRVLIRLPRVNDSSVSVLFGNKVAPAAQQISLNFEYAPYGEALILVTSPPGSGTVNVSVNSTFGPYKVGRFTYR